MRRLALPLLCAAWACAHVPTPRAPPAGPTVRTTAHALLDAVEAEGAVASLVVLDAVTGETLVARRDATRLLPASTMKVVTTAAALARFGPDFRFRTPVTLDGVVDGDLFDGSLVVQASGDPSLGSWRWPETSPAGVCDRVAQALVARGITRFRGAVSVRDGAPAPEALFGPGWAWDDASYDYSAPPTPFVFHENVVELRLTRRSSRSCTDAPVVAIEPALPGLTVRVDPVIDARPSLRCTGERGSRLARCLWRRTEETCPAEASVKLAIDAAEGTFAQCVDDAIARAGVERVPQSPEPRPPAALSQPLLELESPPLSELVRATNKESLNLYAERLALLLARAVSGTESYEGVREALLADLAFRGIDGRDVALTDGSGLSRYNLATARALARVVQTSLSTSYATAFLESLPIAGVDGTLEKRCTEGAAKGLVRAKTGGMSGQRAFVGIADRPTDAAHPRVVFALMISNTQAPALPPNEVFDRLAEALVTLPVP